MKIFTKFFLVSLACSLLVPSAKCQDDGDYLFKPWQVTLFPPYSTNGMEGKNCVNRFSLNLLWGVNAGLEGIEYGSFVNI